MRSFCRFVPTLIATSVLAFFNIVSADELDSWSVRNAGVTNDLTCVTFGGGMFVAGGRGIIMRSTNGVDWVRAANTFPTADGGGAIVFATIGFGNGLFVAADGSSGYRVWKSTNAINWEIVEQNLIVPESIAFGNGMFVLGGCPNGGNTAYSFDGTRWTRTHGMTSFDYIKSIAYGNAKFVAGGYPVPEPSPATHSGLWQSTNGISWTRLVEAPVQSVVFGAGKFLVNIAGSTPGSADASVSPDVLTVAERLSAYGAGLFLGYPRGNQIMTRSVAGPWIGHSFPASTLAHGTNTFWCYGQGTFLGVGPGGTVIQSARMLPRLDPPTRVGSDISITGRVPGAQSVTLETSTNLKAWTPAKSLRAQDEETQTSQPFSSPAGGTFFRLRVTQ
jgi:hypothetical protein